MSINFLQQESALALAQGCGKINPRVTSKQRSEACFARLKAVADGQAQDVVSYSPWWDELASFIFPAGRSFALCLAWYWTVDAMGAIFLQGCSVVKESGGRATIVSKIEVVCFDMMAMSALDMLAALKGNLLPYNLGNTIQLPPLVARV